MINEQTNKRLANREAILKTLHFEGALQRSALSTRCNIRKSSVTSITADLIESGMIRETEPGRFRSAVEINSDNHTALVANITPRSISFARVNLGGRIINQTSLPVRSNDAPHTLTQRIAEKFSELRKEQPHSTIGIGVALPGIIDPARGLCIQAVNLNQWNNIPLGPDLTQMLGTPVIIDNDVRCQLHACTWFERMARDAENILYILIHDGVSCALMSRGKLIIGERFTAGEIGHTKAGDEGRLCACGRHDCLETYCSLPAIISEIKLIHPELKLKTASDLAAAAKITPAIDNILDRTANRLARSLTGIVAATDPAALVLGTADRTLSETLRPHLRRHLYSEMLGLQSCLTDDKNAKITTAGNAETETLRGIAAKVIRRSFRHP